MKLKLDENLGKSVGTILKNAGHDVETITGEGLRGAKDKEVIAVCKTEGRFLALFAQKDRTTAQDVAAALGLSTRMVRILLNKWADDGWLLIADTSNRGRVYALSESYRQFIGN